jgi:chromosome segregation ATPase
LIEERLIMLQTQYDDEKARTHDLQLKLAEVNGQKIEIESKLNKSASSTSDMQQSSETMVGAFNELKTKMARTQSMLDDELRKNKKFEENIEYLSEF